MKTIFRVLAPLLVLLWLVPPVHAVGSNIPAEVQSAATRGLELFKSKTSTQPRLYGFSGAEDVNRTTLGRGFRIYYVDPDKLRSQAQPKSLLAIAYPAEVWEFVVTLDGQPKSFLTIARQDGQYQMVRFGGDATDFDVAAGNFVRFAKERDAAIEPVVVKAGPVHYFTGKFGEQELIVAEARTGGGLNGSGDADYTRLRDASEIVKHLQDVQKNTPRGEMSGGGSPSAQSENTSRWAQLWAVSGLVMIGGVLGTLHLFRRARAR